MIRPAFARLLENPSGARRFDLQVGVEQPAMNPRAKVAEDAYIGAFSYSASAVVEERT
ncbi:MAG: hypothetical protein IPH00_15985 [Flavobacteriales bacterium]|nr:hypothetical protein [Flavobacteriales bacterium]